MARRNLFQPPPPPPEEPADGRPRFPNTGAMSGVKSTLRDLSSNAVREIDPALIDDGGPKDRLAFSDADVADLAESIRQHGQQVPIMVRPLADQPGRYRIVYGRRRLRALRLIGVAAKALVRTLSDEQAIVAQGQENSQRLDPSFIEKALFAAELGSAGYEPAVILDALAIDKPMLSRMNKVAREIPEAVAQLIGPAHGIGRRRWEDLADATRDHDLDLIGLAQGIDGLDQLASDERFARIAAAAARPETLSPPPAQLVAHPDGTPLAELRETPRAVTLRLPSSDFSRWVRDNADNLVTRLYDEWQSTARKG
ncbi:plasmid partitioning protein RepB [Gemmobacter sp.]|uniref:plasmid partitioning protein RepB n=1 Tax=Gemmobacter sp. TaxID=1898957 RepID=UPI002AFF4298|nr:plasmid partitioning protein RepB [Gemmobacter sp.]